MFQQFLQITVLFFTH